MVSSSTEQVASVALGDVATVLHVLKSRDNAVKWSFQTEVVLACHSEFEP